MEFTVKLQQLMHISISWLLLGLVFAALCGLFFWLFFRSVNKPAPEPEPVPEPEKPKPALWQIQRKYLRDLDMLFQRRTAGNLPMRDSYLLLSGIARGFVRDATGRDADKMTLTELQLYSDSFQSAVSAGTNPERAPGNGMMPQASMAPVDSVRLLTELIGEFYEPEFALRSEADFAHSCAETRRMIQTWR